MTASMGDRPGWHGLLGSMRVRILAAVVVLLASSSAVSIALLRSALLQRLDAEITTSMRRETEEFELLAGGLNPRTGAPFGDDLRAVFDVYYAREVPDEGEALLAFASDELYRAEQAQGAAPADRLGQAIAHWRSLDTVEEGSLSTPAGEVRYRALPLTAGRRDGLLVVAHFPAAERAEIDAAVRAQAVTQFGAVVLASLIGLGLAGRVLRPLRSLADTARTISDTDLTRRIPVRGDDEASLIASAFNDMLERLEQVFATQRRFLDDAGHELRVPLTVIRGHVDLLEHETDPAERAAIEAVIADEIDRMTRIVDDLLLLARADRPDFLTIGRVDLAELTRDVVRKAAVLCDREWGIEASARGIIAADGQRLTQAMMQLAQNACQHTEPGTPILAGSAFDGEHARLWVQDRGPGVPPEDAGRIFERFVRAGRRLGGSGLGLSIVAAIAEAHGGQARLAPHAGPGARFEIMVPAVAAPGSVLEAAERGPHAGHAAEADAGVVEPDVQIAGLVGVEVQRHEPRDQAVRPHEG
jgi:signal transduction histidine kinase